MCDRCIRNEGVRRAFVAALTSRLPRALQPKRPKVVAHLAHAIEIIAPPSGLSPAEAEERRTAQKAELQRFVDGLSFDEVYALGAAGASMASLFEVISSWASGSIARRAEAGEPAAARFLNALPPDEMPGVMVVSMAPGFGVGGSGDTPLVH